MSKKHVSEREFREALHLLVSEIEGSSTRGRLGSVLAWASYSQAKALLARPEPDTRITLEEADKRLDRYYQARHKQECFDAPLDTLEFTNPRAEVQEATAGVLDAMGVER